LNLASTDFGYGWTYALNSMDVELDESREDVVLGTGNSMSLDPFEDIYPGPQRVVSIRNGGGRDVTLTLPDGRRTTFRFKPIFHPEDMTADATRVAPSDVTDKLEPLDSGIINLLISTPPFWQDGGFNSTFETHDIAGWKLTSRDGTVYNLTRGESENILWSEHGDGHFINVKTYNAQPKLTSIVQRSGDTIQFTEAGIFHYNATNGLTRSVFIERDGVGRIVAIRDPNSGSNGMPVMKYVYNRDTGNLIQVHRLQGRNTGNYTISRYHYDHPKFPHYITSIEDPRGVPLARNEYDDD
jgi:hypothetical protein